MLHQMHFHRFAGSSSPPTTNGSTLPGVVDPDPIGIRTPAKGVAYQLRTRVDLEPIAVTDAQVWLADAGHPNPRLRTDHRIVAAGMRVALLRL